MIRESSLLVDDAVFREVVWAGDYYLGKVDAGQTFRILDLEGNQAADTLFFCADNPAERYSATDTIREQHNVYLTARHARDCSRHLRSSRHPRRRLCHGE